MKLVSASNLPTSPVVRWISLATALVLAVIVFGLVDLTPEVGSDFFFSTDDPRLQADKEIDRLFSSASQIILAAASEDIRSPGYFKKVGELSDQIGRVDGIGRVFSVTQGPENPEQAFESPLWKRLLISPDGSATNLIASVASEEYKTVVPEIQRIVSIHDSPGFRVAISGVPFVVYQVQHNLVRDLRVFGLAAVLVFGLLVALIFRSTQILLGILVACSVAAFLTLLFGPVLGMKPGILTPNISTIVFVLTLSHIMFLLGNWTNARLEGDTQDQVGQAISRTGPASFWSMVTTFLGFMTLLMATANPLQQFGVSCAFGSLAAIASAYLVFPSFLARVSVSEYTRWPALERVKSLFEGPPRFWVIPGVLVLSLAALPGLWRLNTDPSLLSYFKDGSAVREGLERIDASGGSSPLRMVIKNANGDRLDNQDAFTRMMALHQDLEEHRAVGSVVSLPLLMAEARRHPFAFLFSWETLFEQLESPERGQVARQFVTRQRDQGLFQLRMKEAQQVQSREQVVSQLHSSVREHGFEPQLTGGIYRLQGQLSSLVTSSIFTGLGGLLVLFSAISFVISRSLKVGTWMIVSFCLIPVCLLGVIGHLRTPIDIITAPSANVALAIGIDGMIHLVFAARRAKGKSGWEVWNQARTAMWRPILASSLIIAMGFGLFSLSTFPPTQRFGLAVVGGMLLAVVIVLLVFPVVAAKVRYRLSGGL
jgi:uncharacterized protein